MTNRTTNAKIMRHGGSISARCEFEPRQARTSRRSEVTLLAPFATFLVAGLAALAGCASQRPAADEAGVRQASGGPGLSVLATADSEIVDCQLPPVIYRLGTKLVYLGSPREIRTTARDCAIRGGGLIASDPANGAT
jgi:hypothetical protein